MERQRAVGDVIQDPSLAQWGTRILVEELPQDAAFSWVLGVAPTVRLDTHGDIEFRQWPHLANVMQGERWRDLAAVVVNVNPIVGEVYVIVRHGPVFRLLRQPLQSQEQ